MHNATSALCPSFQTSSCRCLFRFIHILLVLRLQFPLLSLLYPRREVYETLSDFPPVENHIMFSETGTHKCFHSVRFFTTADVAGAASPCTILVQSSPPIDSNCRLFICTLQAGMFARQTLSYSIFKMAGASAAGARVYGLEPTTDRNLPLQRSDIILLNRSRYNTYFAQSL